MAALLAAAVATAGAPRAVDAATWTIVARARVEIDGKPFSPVAKTVADPATIDDVTFQFNYPDEARSCDVIGASSAFPGIEVTATCVEQPALDKFEYRVVAFVDAVPNSFKSTYLVVTPLEGGGIQEPVVARGTTDRYIRASLRDHN